jgi:hypothetical protein
VAYQRLSQRIGKAAPDGPYEGVPDHMRGHVLSWFNVISGMAAGIEDFSVLDAIAMQLRVPLSPSGHAGSALLSKAEKDPDFCLDLLDMALLIWGQGANNGDRLEQILRLSGSVWKVASDQQSLELVVNDVMQQSYQDAVAPQDDAATELTEAWSKAFGRSPDPSDAWDHAIKAVECVLIPVVVPNKAKATLGDVVGVLGSPQSAPNWEMILPNNTLSHHTEALASLLRLLWPNHDRHGSGPTPSVDEARAVVCLAATLVQWHRQAWIVRKRQNP